MIPQELSGFIQAQNSKGIDQTSTTTALLQAGWSDEQINQAWAEQSTTEIPRIFSLLSKIFWFLAVTSIPYAFVGILTTQILSNAMAKAGDGMYPFVFLSSLPSYPLMVNPIIYTLSFFLYSIAALKIQTGSKSGWKTALIILIFVIVLQLANSILFQALMQGQPFLYDSET